MLRGGQNLLGGHYIRFLRRRGTPLGDVPAPDNVAFGESQRTVLVGNTGGRRAPTSRNAGVNVTATGGAVCFWNTSDHGYRRTRLRLLGRPSPGMGAPPSPTGTPVPLTGLPTAESLHAQHHAELPDGPRRGG